MCILHMLHEATDLQEGYNDLDLMILQLSPTGQPAI